MTATSDNGATVSPAKQNIDKGNNATIGVTLKSGKALDYVTVNGAVVTGARIVENAYTLENVNTDSAVYIATKNA